MEDITSSSVVSPVGWQQQYDFLLGDVLLNGGVIYQVRVLLLLVLACVATALMVKWLLF
jgi:hypothetical protein